MLGDSSFCTGCRVHTKQRFCLHQGYSIHWVEALSVPRERYTPAKGSLCWWKSTHWPKDLSVPEV